MHIKDLIKLHGGEIKFKSSGWNLDLNKSLNSQEFLLSEDLFHVFYLINNNEYLLDVGWYGELHDNGRFKVVVIKNGNWNKSVFIESCTSLKDLLSITQKAIDYIIELRSGKIVIS